MKPLKLLSLTLLLALAGCQSNNIYYWGNYESTLYDLKKSPSEEMEVKHKAQLEKIISTAKNKNKLVPPGVYFELGMLEAKAGNTQRSLELLTMEKNSFPEANIYVDAAIKELEAKS